MIKMLLHYFNSKDLISMYIILLGFPIGGNCFMEAIDTFIRQLKKKGLILVKKSCFSPWDNFSDGWQLSQISSKPQQLLPKTSTFIARAGSHGHILTLSGEGGKPALHLNWETTQIF
jgi:hypothetical protein